MDALRDTLAGKIIIDGNVTIGTDDIAQSDITDLTPLNSITHITGNLWIQQNGQLVNLNSLNDLQFIGGYFRIDNNEKLTTFGNFPALQSIGEYFIVTSNEKLTTFGNFPTLQSIGEYFRVESNDRLTTLGNFIALQSIGGYFRVESNEKLTILRDFPALDFIGEYFGLISNEKLTDLGNFPALMSIGIGNNVNIPSSDESKDNVSIVVEKNPRLSNCYDVLTEFFADSSHAVSGNIFINDNALKGGCNSQNGIINSIYQGNITVTTQAEVDALDTSTLAGKFRIEGNLTIMGSAGTITSLTPLNNITHITGDVYIQQNVQLTNLDDLNSLQSIGGTFVLVNNNSLTTFGNFPNLHTIGGNFGAGSNSNLSTLGNFPVLQSIGGNFGVENNEKLTDLGDFPALTSIGIGTYYWRNNVSIVVECNYSLSDCYVLTKFLSGGSYAVGGGYTY